MDLFLKFFRIKTGIDWEDRVIKQGTTALSLFQYTPPVSQLRRRKLPWYAPIQVLTVSDQRQTSWSASQAQLRLLS